MPMLTTGAGAYPAPAGGSYSAEALAVFAAMTTPPDTPRKNLIDACIVSLKNAGIWTILDSLQVYAAADSQAARVDWVLPSRVATIATPPTFTTDRGFTSNGTTQFLDTGYTPGTQYTQNSATVSIWSRTSAQMGTLENITGAHTAGSRLVAFYLRNASDSLNMRLNESTGTAIANTDGSGMFTGSRTGASAGQIYRNGSSLGVASLPASSGIPANAFTVCKANTTFSTREAAMFAAGGGMNATQAADFYTAMQTYMTGVGA